MFDDLIQQNAAHFGVPESWIRAVIQTESSFNPAAYRAEPQIQDASYGLMQLLYRTAKGLGYTGTPEGLYDPATNIRLGTQLLADHMRRYGDDIRRVYSAYNSGKPDLWETSSQVKSNVERLLRNLERIIQQEPLVMGSGVAGGVIVVALMWYWAGRKKGK